MASNTAFTILNDLVVGSTTTVAANGVWVGSTQNIRGPQGPSGFQGPQGAQGSLGAQGPQGSIGNQGPGGNQGSVGATGAQGSAGAQGPQGAQGPAGNPGSQGPQGFQGLVGSSPVGAQGAQGNQGATGPQGPQGGTGPAGFQGPTGLVGVIGPTGNPGASGFQGTAGAQGPIGNIGPPGSTGATGNQGPQGPQGPLATSSIITSSGWTTGSGGITGYGQNGDTVENERVNDTDPFGNTAVVWETRPTGTADADGGWNTSSFAIDNTKRYRFSVWVRRTTATSGGTFYLGVYGLDSGDGNIGVKRNDGGGTETNPYWECSGTSKFTQNVWYLVVGHVFPLNSTETGAHPESGIYTVAGGTTIQLGLNFCNIGADVQWVSASAARALHRTYHYYCADNTTRLQFAYPRVDVCDGTEPPINELVRAASSLVRYGPQGTQGSGGSQGPQGFTGATGFTGNTGPTGNPGPQGGTGPAGFQGPGGPTGGTGPAGFQGVQGQQGVGGGFGPNGGIGAGGPQGPTGGVGPPGNQGGVGPTGPTGAPGPQGPVGPAPPGPIGITGPTGNAGPAGAQGPSGFQGNQGSAGPGGRQGFQGNQGPQGATGGSGASPPGAAGNGRANRMGGVLNITPNGNQILSPSGAQGEIRMTSTYVQNYSDKRFKEIISLVEDPLKKINSLNGVFYEENDLAKKFGYNNPDRQVGLIAQEVQSILPEAIAIAPFDSTNTGNSASGEYYLTIKYERTIPLLIEALKKQKEQIDYLRNILMKQAIVTVQKGPIGPQT